MIIGICWDTFNEAGRCCVPSRFNQPGGSNRMFDTGLIFLAITASLGIGGVLGLIALVCMAIEIKREGY